MANAQKRKTELESVSSTPPSALSPASSVAASASSALDSAGTGSPRREGELTKRIEAQTAKVPSVGYLGLAIGSMAISAGLLIFARKKEFANFVGLWAPSFMLVGIYNKLVKLEGSDASSG